LLTILMGMPLIGFYNGAIGQALNAAGLQGTVARVAALAAGVNVLLNLALVPMVGLVGAAVAAVFTEIVTATAYTRAVRPLAGFAPIRAYVATADAVAIMAVLLIALPDLALPVTILIGVAAYLAVVLVRRPASLVAVSRMIGR
jgi:O-antigen/teichoic acid export membrane protein